MSPCGRLAHAKVRLREPARKLIYSPTTLAALLPFAKPAPDVLAPDC